MTELSAVRNWLDDNFAALRAKHGVPGAVVAVLAEDEIVDVATGVLNVATGDEVDPDSVFQIGSITKVWTATLVMQLVDERRVDLDAPVRTYLPDLRVADEVASAQITVRQLLSHSAGFEGDIVKDTGRGDDAVQRYVTEVLPNAPQLFPPGQLFSYNNAGFVVLGRIVEVLREQPWASALRTWLAEPLGLTRVATRAAEAILLRAAVGHVGQSDDPAPAKVWEVGHCHAPAGSMLAMTARDLLSFVRMHLQDGRTPDGGRVLSDGAVRTMQQPQIEWPKLRCGSDKQGLGWFLPDCLGGRVIGHDGGTVGQSAFLQVVPDKRVAVALLTNSANSEGLRQELFRHLLDNLADVKERPPLTTPNSPTPVENPKRYVGTYQAEANRIQITQTTENQLSVSYTPLGELAALLGMDVGADSPWGELVALDGGTFAILRPNGVLATACTFHGKNEHGQAAILHIGQAVPRRDTA